MTTTKTGSAPTTVLHAFRRGVHRHPDRVLVRTKDDEVRWTWADVAERAERLAGGFRSLGVQRGTVVGLLLSNRPSFYPTDLGVLLAGGVPVSLYQTSSPEQIGHIVADAELTVLVTEQLHLDRVLRAQERFPRLRTVVVVDGEAHAGTLTLSEVAQRGTPVPLDEAVDAVDPDDLVTLIYTSGTTGPPKGVELTHRSIVAAMTAIGEVSHLEPGGRVISWLPAAHIAERNAHYYGPLLFGLEITVCPDARQIAAYLVAVRPDSFFAVPRIWEKLKAGLEAAMAGQSEEQRAPVQAAIDRGLERVRLTQTDAPVPEALAEAVAQDDAEIFAPLRAMLGLDRVSSVNVGAAPTPASVIEFFHAIGLPIAEIWGLSETSACGTLNPPERIKIGSVGPAVPGMELRLEADGEVLLRGTPLMRGYHHQAARTREALDDDGWFRTGDLGRIDEDGYLWIIDRKKELIINATGKNMSPANIEAAVKTAHPLIGQACVIGDGRPYNTALIVLDADVAPVWAARHGLDAGNDMAALARDPAMVAEVQRGIDAANATLSRVEQVKRFVIVPQDWIPGGDELTPTMKLMRAPISRKYAAEIEMMYA